MYKVIIYSFEIGKSDLGADVHGTENNIRRRHTTINFIWSPSVEGVLDITCYKAKLIRVQRLINIRIAKAYRTVSNEALCVITGLIPINIKIEETAKYYESVKGEGNLFDREMEVKHWTHPANTVEITDGQEDSKHIIHVYTDGIKSEHGEGSGIAIFQDSKLIDTKNTN